MCKKNTMVIVIVFGIALISVTGCRTSGSQIGTSDLAVSGGIELGRLEELDKQLGRIVERERNELSRAAGSVDDIEGIIQSVFGIAFRLCDEVDSVRAELKAITASQQDTLDSSDSAIGIEAD